MPVEPEVPFRRPLWHGARMRRRSALTSAFAVVVLVLGQLAALAHEASTRHVMCAEHGESIEAVRLASADDGCQQSHWVGVDGERGGDHADCEISRTLHQASIAPHGPLPALVVIVPAKPAPIAAPRPVDHRFALYRIAPKTSPPHAG